MKYTVLYQKEPEGGFTAYVPALPGCVTFGNTLEESQNMIQEAISLYIDSLQAHKEKIPSEENTFISHIDIPAIREETTNAFSYA